MSRKSILKTIGSFSMALVVLVESATLVGAQTLADRLSYTDDSAASDILFDTYYYTEYLKDNELGTADSFESDINIFAFEGNPLVKEDKEKGKVIYTDHINTDITYKFSVPSDGMYEFFVDYFCIDGNSQDISRGIKIDGEYPFEEAKNVFFKRSFVDSDKPKVNNLGDEVMPSQLEVKRWMSTGIYDNGGMYGETLKFALKAGEHTITFDFINQPMLISKITVKSAEILPTYNEKKAEYKKKGYKNAKSSVRFEAEDYEHVFDKSASSILMATSSNSTMTPLAVTSRKYNGIGGGTWSSGGDSITWKFEAPEAGLYKLALRSVQNPNSGMPSSRRIEIDDKIPFAEMAEYVFEYDAEWQTNILSNEKGEPYLFYLDKGEHTIRMTAVNGEITDIIHKVSEANAMLSNCYQNIVMVTGQSPDLNYDYELDKSIPALFDDLQDVIDVLESCAKDLRKVTNETATIENSINQAIDTIDGYKKNVDAIPGGLSDFTSAITNMGEWLTTLKTQYLFLDYITFANPDEELANPHQTFIDLVVNTVKNLFLSYTKDYNAVGSLNSATGKEAKELEVWLSKSKEWAEIIKDLADSEFSIEKNVNLKVNLLPEGAFAGTVNTLLLSVNAGKEPDVVLNMTPANTSEYAVRGVIKDLTKFEDFKEVKKYTFDQLYNHVSYGDAVYGLPETMEFKALIYRTDIFEKLKIKVPDTWDEVYNTTLPKLYQNNLQMFIPQSFHLFLYQNGGQLYTEDKRKSALDTDSAFRAFDQFIGNYQNYGFPYNISFINRFRTGEVPIGVGGMADYLTVAFGASELVGKWSIAPVPATVNADGSLNRSTGEALGTVSVMMESTTEPELAWDFLKWWISTETQSEYGLRLESVLGTSARWGTANVEAYRSLPWSVDELKVIETSWKGIVEAPYVPGSYFTTRHITNAISRCLTGGYKPRASLEEAIEAINVELERKREELGLDD